MRAEYPDILAREHHGVIQRTSLVVPLVRDDTAVGAIIVRRAEKQPFSSKQITLLDLSMQVSGLPRLPNNMNPADPGNPYADYDAASSIHPHPISAP